MNKKLKQLLKLHRMMYPNCSKACFCWDIEELIYKNDTESHLPKSRMRFLRSSTSFLLNSIKEEDEQ
jgi:hypothetical protein